MTEAPCFVLASRLIPDQDGGFARAVMRRAHDLGIEGIDVTVLTVDPGATHDHAEQRAEWVRRGELHDAERMRNLFDDARADASWLRNAATGTTVPAAVDYTDFFDAAGVRVLSLPIIAGDPRWHASDAPVIVYDAAGEPIGSVAGFGGLYRAWLSHVVPPDGVVIVEARQLGELLATWQSPARIIHTVHTNHLEPPYTPDAPVNALWTNWFAIADLFDTVAWPTEAQAADVRARFGTARADVVVPNGVDSGALGVGSASAVGESASVGGVASTGGAARRAVMVNRLAPGKRVDHAIRAWAAVIRDVPEARLDIFGDGPERERLAALIIELGLSESVTLHGHVADPAECYRDADFLLLTTAFEGQGLVVGEALAAGVPVISYDVAYGPRDVLQRGGGMLVPSGDEPALLAAILDVLHDSALHAQLVAEAPSAVAPLERRAVSRQWADLVRSVASRPTRR